MSSTPRRRTAATKLADQAKSLSRADIARCIGVGAKQVDAMKARGCPQNEDGRYSLISMFAWLREQIDELRKGRGADDLARWRRLRADREELQLAKEHRAMVSRVDVIEFAAQAVDIVRQRLNDMVQKMAGRLANQPEHVIAEELQAEVDSICAAWERGMGKCRHVGGDPKPLPESNHAGRVGPQHHRPKGGS